MIKKTAAAMLRSQSRVRPDSRLQTVASALDPNLSKKLNTEKLEAISEMSETVLFRAKTYFPLDLFPDEIIINVAKIDVIVNEFLSRRIIPVYYQNISDVFVDSGIIFSRLSIVDLGFVENTVEINNLLNKDALEAMRIIQGFVVAIKQGVDLTKVDVAQYLPKLKTIGKPRFLPST